MGGVNPPATSHVVADQTEVHAFLGIPGTHNLTEPIKRIDTHGAVVFLAGPNAYKVKRAVRFPFMDYSTLERRRAACEAEVAVNRPNAPDLYVGVLPITRSGGNLALGGNGEVVEWAVHMRRFDERRTLDRVAEAGALTPALIAKLARAIHVSHEKAFRREGGPATAALARYIEQNHEALTETPELFPPDRVAALTAAATSAFAAVGDLLQRRGDAGYVRRCHGDLHLRNIVLLGEEPTLFDAVEFDETIATGDILYDLAFLVMDLCERGLGSAANQLLNRYLWQSDEANLSALAAMPLFLSIRAAIRAKVIAAGLPHLRDAERGPAADEARRYFDCARHFLARGPARLIAIGGLSGTGKSTLATALAPQVGGPPGAVHLRSDVERKRLFGAAETQRLPAEAYAPDVTDRIYATLLRKAGLALAAGSSVVLDAVHAHPHERAKIASLAQSLGVAFQGFWLDAPVAMLLDRVKHRTADASDADARVVAEQSRYELGEIDWRRLDASKPLAALVSEVQQHLWLSHRPGC